MSDARHVHRQLVAIETTLTSVRRRLPHAIVELHAQQRAHDGLRAADVQAVTVAGTGSTSSPTERAAIGGLLPLTIAEDSIGQHLATLERTVRTLLDIADKYTPATPSDHPTCPGWSPPDQAHELCGELVEYEWRGDRIVYRHLCSKHRTRQRRWNPDR